jgi:hypothetical protein
MWLQQLPMVDIEGVAVRRVDKAVERYAIGGGTYGARQCCHSARDLCRLENMMGRGHPLGTKEPLDGARRVAAALFTGCARTV